MAKKELGSSYEPWLTAKQVASILDVSAVTVRRMSRSGFFSAELQNGEWKYCREEVIATLDSEKRRPIDIQLTASRALAIAERLDRQLQLVTRYLGLDAPMLGTTEDDVVALYIRVEEALEEKLHFTAEETYDWARIFFAMSPEYLELVYRHTRNATPWRPFLDLARFLFEKAAAAEVGRDLRAASAYVHSARNHLMAITHVYLQPKMSERTAHQKFPELKEDPDEPILLGLFALPAREDDYP